MTFATIPRILCRWVARDALLYNHTVPWSEKPGETITRRTSYALSTPCVCHSVSYWHRDCDWADGWPRWACGIRPGQTFFHLGRITRIYGTCARWAESLSSL